MYLKILGLFIFMVVTYCQDHHHGHSFALKTLITHEVPNKENHYQVPEYNSAPIQKQVINELHTIPSLHGNGFSSQSVESAPTFKTSELYQEAPERAYFTPHEPAPVYEAEEPVRAPVQLKIVKQGPSHAPAQHRVVQLVPRVPILPGIPAAARARVAPIVHQVPFAPINRQVPIAPIIHHAPIAPIIYSAPIGPVIHQAPIAPIIHQAPIAPIIHQAPIAPVIHQAPIQQHNFEVPHQVNTHVIQETHQLPIQDHTVEISRAPLRHHEESHVRTQSHLEESSYNEHHHHEVDYYAHPKYEFSYQVNDPHTHDQKYQHESRDGDVVNGVYSLHEPDGSVRTVKYSSDKKTGFNAEVSHKGHSTHIVPHHHH